MLCRRFWAARSWYAASCSEQQYCLFSASLKGFPHVVQYFIVFSFPFGRRAVRCSGLVIATYKMIASRSALMRLYTPSLAYRLAALRHFAGSSPLRSKKRCKTSISRFERWKVSVSPSSLTSNDWLLAMLFLLLLHHCLRSSIHLRRQLLANNPRFTSRLIDGSDCHPESIRFIQIFFLTLLYLLTDNFC